jgi:hypothetical protein
VSNKRTQGGPRRTKSIGEGKGRYKHPRIIALSDVATRFDDACVRTLALPPGADLQVCGWWLREAAEIFVGEAKIPTANEIRDEIASLHDAAERRAFEKAAHLLEHLSLETYAMLGEALPAPAELRNEILRDNAAYALASLCRVGARRVKGRRRSSGKRSCPSLRPHFYAPMASKNFLKRQAERNFVERISIAWFKSTGKKPPRTARREDAGRDIGPFARFVRECLRLVGANYADPVALINEVAASTKTATVRPSRINP